MNVFIQRSGHLRAGVMKSAVIKRSIFINGRRTSVSLENEFWDALHAIADRGNIAPSAVVGQIDRDRDNINLSSAIRVFVFNHFRPLSGTEAKQNSYLERRSANSGSLRARAEECRTFAEAFDDAKARKIMLRVAADYEDLADRLERVASMRGQKEFLHLHKRRIAPKKGNNRGPATQRAPRL
jgi:predicted DNA-binding ribbon-helix-helix protein